MYRKSAVRPRKLPSSSNLNTTKAECDSESAAQKRAAACAAVARCGQRRSKRARLE